MKPDWLIVGLGNTGSRYEATRHNAGFDAVDRLGEEYGIGPWCTKTSLYADVREATIDRASVLLIKPQTFMNRSGTAVHAALHYYKLDPASHLFVCCDDVDLPLGTLRLLEKGSVGTHNGLQSIVDHCGEHFARLRIGIGPRPPTGDLADWVLRTMGADERSRFLTTIATVPRTVSAFIDARSKSTDPALSCENA